MIVGLIRLTLFHTQYETPSGPGAEVGEDLERASMTSSFERRTAEWFLVRRSRPGRGSLGGKKWSSSALLIVTGSEAPGRDGNLGVTLFLGATSSLAVQTLFGQVLARKSAQWEAFTLFMALE